MYTVQMQCHRYVPLKRLTKTLQYKIAYILIRLHKYYVIESDKINFFLLRKNVKIYIYFIEWTRFYFYI